MPASKRSSKKPASKPARKSAEPPPTHDANGRPILPNGKVWDGWKHTDPATTPG
jgi:hypothetical protein